LGITFAVLQATCNLQMSLFASRI